MFITKIKCKLPDMGTQKLAQNQEHMTIGEMVANDYRTAEVFKKFGLDFCCGGGKTLDEVCKRKGVDKEALSEALHNITAVTSSPSKEFGSMDLDFLVDYIIDTHHKYVNEALPLLDEFGAKVARVHGDAQPEVVEIYEHYSSIAGELRMHMHKEERILFPYIGQLALAKRNGESAASPPFGSIANPIKMMEIEHKSVGETLEKIKELSSDYVPPDHACNTYRVLYAKLQEFADDLYEHIHLENNILFPKAIQLEKELLN